MNIFGIGLPEMAVIAAIALLVFGPKRLPEFGRTLGRTLRGFQSASQEFEQEFRNAMGTVQNEASATTAPIAPATEDPALSGSPVSTTVAPEVAEPQGVPLDASGSVTGSVAEQPAAALAAEPQLPGPGHGA